MPVGFRVVYTQSMDTKHLHLAPSRIVAVAAAATAATAVFFGPVEPLQWSNWHRPSLALAQAQATDEATNIQVYRKASPAVVSIDAGREAGSGSIISPDGLVLTNAHVIDNASQPLLVTLAEGQKVQADIVAFGEAGVDLAVLRLRGQHNLPTIALAAASSVQVGQRAFTIGNPFGRFQGTFTTGIVSRIDTELGLIQTDAAINPGNSGGPLLNSRGELIGVNTSIFTSGRNPGNIGIGFAIAIDRIHPFLSAVRSGQAPRISPRQRQRPPSLSNRPSQPLRLNGVAIQGKLDRNSQMLSTDRSLFDIYTFAGKAGQRVTIEMTSQEINPYLVLLAPNERELAHDNDGGNGRNARISIILPMNGTYALIANAYEAGETGTYRLAAMAEPVAPPGSQFGRPGGSGPTHAHQVILKQAGVLGPGASILRSDGSLYKEYTFQGEAGQFVLITLESPDFDTYLVTIGPNDQVVGKNDDAGASSNSALAITLPQSGTYRVIVNAYNKQGRGRYLLTIR